MFDRWDVNVPYHETLIQYLQGFVRKHFGGFSGAMNLETIGGTIIEIHLRFSDQWPDLYPPDFMDAVVMLRARPFSMGDPAWRRQWTGYSVVLFERQRRTHWKKPPTHEIQSLLRLYKVSSIQLPFHEEQPAEQHSMPPGGFRLAVIDGFSLDECLKAREHLSESFQQVNASLMCGSNQFDKGASLALTRDTATVIKASG